MDYINISIDQNEVDSHLSVPTEKLISHSCEVPVMPELYWHKITTLGFGYEKEKSDSDSDEKLLDYAASLFAACRQPFSVLCEKKSGSIVYAIGSQDKNLASRLLKSAFGTVKAEKYNPVFSASSGLDKNPISTKAVGIFEFFKINILGIDFASLVVVPSRLVFILLMIAVANCLFSIFLGS